MDIRDYRASKDLRAVRRIWKECGWIKNIEEDGTFVEPFFEAADDALVGILDGEAECAVHGANGDITYQDECLPMGGVMAVTTSRVARKRRFAARATAELVARQAISGMAVSALGMFDQGFYNQVGFGTGSYEQHIRFDPATLTIDSDFRPPRRLEAKDFAAVHAAMCHRRRTHGSVSFPNADILKAELNWIEEPFGLGYFDGPNGELTHFIFGTAKAEHGPYEITWQAWQTPTQLFELLALIRSLGDQVYSVSMLEIGDLQIQDLLRQPIRNRLSNEKGEYRSGSDSLAYWQIRMLDLPHCLGKTSLPGPDVRFNLTLTDPIEAQLPPNASWKGIGGEYVVRFGEQSSAESGRDSSLPTLSASVGAFSRLWLGIRPASSLAITDDLQGEESLLNGLDRTVRPPRAHPGWDF